MDEDLNDLFRTNSVDGASAAAGGKAARSDR